MADGGRIGLRVGVLAAVGCVAVAVILTASGTHSGNRRDGRATSEQGPVTTTVTRPAPDAEASPAAVEPEASPEATSSNSVPAATPPAATPPAVLPMDALPDEVAQSLADLAAQLSQVGDDGRPQEMTREEITDLLTAQLQALGIQL